MRSGERGDIVLGWIVKLIVSLAIVGVVVFEAGAVVVAHVSADTAATEVSGAAVDAYGGRGGPDSAEEAARAEATKQGVTLVAFSFGPDGKSLSVTIEKKAKTLLLHRISATRSWAIVRITRSRPVPS